MNKKNKFEVGNVIPMKMDASFFSDRAIYNLDRQKYDKALKYYRIAVDKEYDDPNNHYNLASILAELGRFEESNQILKNILDNIDATMYECFYYIANNYAYLDNLDKAEKYLKEYLKNEPEGIFAAEASEMVLALSEEIDTSEIALPEASYIQNHEKACDLLESGLFCAAIDLLKDITVENPDFYPAWNNLALAYYYTENFNESERITKEVLTLDNCNINAYCNLALLYNKSARHEEAKVIIDGLKKVIPIDIDVIYKIANTLGILKEDNSALKLFKFLMKNESANIFLYHYIAVSYFNLGQLPRANDYWSKAKSIDPYNDVIKYYEYHSNASVNGVNERLNYGFFLPFEELLIIKDDEKFQETLLQSWEACDSVVSSYLWATEKGEVSTLEKIDTFNARVLQLMNSEELLIHLDRRYPASASKMIQHIKSKEIGYIKRRFTLNQKLVLELCLDKMMLTSDQKSNLTELWSQFCQHADECLIKRIETWAGALHYVYNELQGIIESKQTISQQYDIPINILGKNIKKIRELFNKND